jgi:Cytochrome c554 and c-prime
MMPPLPRILFRPLVFAWALAMAGGAASCSGCHTASTAKGPLVAGPPTVRLYFVSDLAGAIEPCGCSKDQLGGLDHAGAWIAQERAKAPASALVTAGPLFFMDPTLKPEKVSQDTQKAETLAAVLKQLDFAAFAPAKNEWAAGLDELGKLKDVSGAAMLFGNAQVPGAVPFVVREIGGVKVAFLGVASPDVPGVDAKSPADAIKAAAQAAKSQGAKILVALASVGRGEAKRIADAVPELTAILVGSTGGAGDANTQAPPPERVGTVLIAETGNHLQTVAVLDLYVKDGSGTFADATGLELGRKREELQGRIDDLHVKIANWDKDAKVSKTDVDARRADLAKLEADKAELDVAKPPETGSYFRYTVKEIRDTLGKDPKLEEQLLAYYKRVNEANKIAFADRKPRPHDGKGPVYIGVDACSSCHEEPKDVWDKTKHASAYATLTKGFKEFNLDCVSCHVTGYDMPGGSTVTHVDRLKDVQCEQCHGPGSRHAMAPEKVQIPVPKPKPDMCLSCHHSPHVEGFDAKAKMDAILGPGHGKK